MFNQAVTTAQMSQDLEAPGITVLAPSDGAMQAVPNIDTIINDPDLSHQLVSAHIIPGAMDADTIFSQSSVGPYQVDGANRTITGPSGTASISQSEQASNGWVHTLTAVLDVPAAATAPTA